MMNNIEIDIYKLLNTTGLTRKRVLVRKKGGAPAGSGITFEPIDGKLSSKQIESVVTKLSEMGLLKTEKGVRTEWRTVTRGGKTFRQRFKVGQKEPDGGVIDKWIEKNIDSEIGDRNALKNALDRIRGITGDAMSKHTADEYYDKMITHRSVMVRRAVIPYLNESGLGGLVNDKNRGIREDVALHTNDPDIIEYLLHDEEESVRTIAQKKHYVIILSGLSDKFLRGEDVAFSNEVTDAIKTMNFDNKENVEAVHGGLDSLYSSDEKMNKFNIYSKEEWLQSSNNVGSGVLKYFMTQVHDETEIRHHDAVDLNNDEVIEEYMDMVPSRSSGEDVIKYIELQHKLTKKLLDIRFPDQDEFVVYRGTTKNEIGGLDINVGDKVGVEQNPISSWSLKDDVAKKFAGKENGVVIKMTVSKDDIWSCFLTHSYSTFEQEMMVIGKGGAEAEIVALGESEKDKSAGMIGVMDITPDDEDVYTDEEIEDFFEAIK